MLLSNYKTLHFKQFVLSDELCLNNQKLENNQILPFGA